MRSTNCELPLCVIFCSLLLFFPFRSTYIPQHPVLLLPLPVFFLNVRESRFNITPLCSKFLRQLTPILHSMSNQHPNPTKTDLQHALVMKEDGETGGTDMLHSYEIVDTFQFMLCMIRCAVLWPVSRVVAAAGLPGWMLSFVDFLPPFKLLKPIVTWY